MLGPLEVSGADRSRDRIPSRERTVLAMLLFRANSVVSVDQLSDAVWNGSPPRTAKGQIQICVSRLRQRFAASRWHGAISTRHPGYVLGVGEGQLDLQVFNQRVAEGRNAVQKGKWHEGRRLLRSALALWRGEAFADVESRALESAATYLSEQRIAVLEECIEVEIRLNRHHEVIGELRRLVAANPYRERLRAQLMHALFRAGRQADALNVYQEGRRTLVDELGLEPGNELRELERAILAGDPALGGTHGRGHRAGRILDPPRVPRLLPATIGDFTGRERVLTELKQRLCRQPDEVRPDGALAAAPEVITGRGGVGKTATAVHLGHQLAAEFPDGQLYARLHRDGLRPTPPEDVLEGFLHALGVPVPKGLEARASLYRDRLADLRLLILLDKAAGEDQVLPLLPGTATCGVVVTSRSQLTGLPGARHTAIEVFDVNESVEFLRKVVGPAHQPFDTAHARSVARSCGGLPLALRAAGARLAAHPHWSMAHLAERLEDGDRVLDELAHGSLDVRKNIMAGCRGLGPRARCLFRRLALLETPDFDGWAASCLLGTGVGEVAEALDELIEAHLVDVRTGAGTASEFRLHGLVRAYARERLLQDESPLDRAAALRRVRP